MGCLEYTVDQLLKSPDCHYTVRKNLKEQTMTPAQSFDPRIDAYIGKSRPFAQPILIHIRELVHEACPTVIETIKWSRPFFE
jgi:hypothetical protein